jgi:uncharacterized protein (TIGR02444 family)
MSNEVPQNSDRTVPGLWDWSIACYSRLGVADAALRLQDGHGLGVNLLLYALWLAQVPGLRLDPVAATAARAATGEWQQAVVAPLRGVRRALKACSHPDAGLATGLRKQVAADELEAERGEQALLAALPLPLPPAAVTGVTDLSARNLMETVLAAGVRYDPPLAGTLASLLAAATGEPLAQAAAALARAADV